jgi:hypothetical protein
VNDLIPVFDAALAARLVMTAGPHGLWLQAVRDLARRNPGVRIGAWATVGAGSVVLKDAPNGVTVAGNPARTLRPA